MFIICVLYILRLFIFYHADELAIGVTVDCAEQRFYWTDVHNGRISNADLDGFEKEVITTGRYWFTCTQSSTSLYPPRLLHSTYVFKLYSNVFILNHFSRCCFFSVTLCMPVSLSEPDLNTEYSMNTVRR